MFYFMFFEIMVIYCHGRRDGGFKSVDGTPNFWAWVNKWISKSSILIKNFFILQLVHVYTYMI